MKLSRVTGRWRQYAGRMKSRWGRLTHVSSLTRRGQSEELVGVLQEHYGVEKRQAEAEVALFLEQVERTFQASGAEAPFRGQDRARRGRSA